MQFINIQIIQVFIMQTTTINIQHPTFGSLVRSQQISFQQETHYSLTQIGERIIIKKQIQNGQTNNIECNLIKDKFKEQASIKQLISEISETDSIVYQQSSKRNKTSLQLLKECQSLELIYFLQYVLDFKLGKAQSYINKSLITQSTSLQKNAKKCHLIRSKTISETQNTTRTRQVKVSSEYIIKQCQQKLLTHLGYCCDSCQIYPIYGSRFHCQKCSNFDLCQKCFTQNGHWHPTEQIRKSKNHQMTGLIKTVNKFEHWKSIFINKSEYKNRIEIKASNH